MVKFIKNISNAVFLIIFLLLFSLSVKNSLAANCSNYGGATTYCDDGTSYSNYGGATTYGSDGTNYSNYGGATTYGSDGSSQSNYGGNTTYSSDGTSYSNYGGSTTYGSDGSTYNNYGGATTYGNGGKMIEVGGSDDSGQNKYYDSTNYDNNDRKAIDVSDNCPLNSSYDSLSSSCKCNYGYVVSGSSCIYKGSDNSDTAKIPSYFPSQQKDEPEIDIISPITNSDDTDSADPIPILDVNSNETQTDQNVSAENVKTENKEKGFIWWNPLTWWSYFFNKPMPVVNEREIELAKSIKNEAPTSSLEWEEYSSDAGKFIALFPHDVIHGDWMDSATMKKLGWNGINKIDTFYTASTNAKSFSVWFHQYTDQRGVADKVTLQKSLNNLLNLMKDYKLTFADHSKHGTYDALDYLIFNERENKYEKGKFIAVKQSVYQIFVDYKGENFNDADINKFFASFYPQ